MSSYTTEDIVQMRNHIIPRIEADLLTLAKQVKVLEESAQGPLSKSMHPERHTQDTSSPETTTTVHHRSYENNPPFKVPLYDMDTPPAPNILSLQREKIAHLQEQLDDREECIARLQHLTRHHVSPDQHTAKQIENHYLTKRLADANTNLNKKEQSIIHLQERLEQERIQFSALLAQEKQERRKDIEHYQKVCLERYNTIEAKTRQIQINDQDYEKLVEIYDQEHKENRRLQAEQLHDAQEHKKEIENLQQYNDHKLLTQYKTHTDLIKRHEQHYNALVDLRERDSQEATKLIAHLREDNKQYKQLHIQYLDRVQEISLLQKNWDTDRAAFRQEKEMRAIQEKQHNLTIQGQNTEILDLTRKLNTAHSAIDTLEKELAHRPTITTLTPVPIVTCTVSPGVTKEEIRDSLIQLIKKMADDTINNDPA